MILFDSAVIENETFNFLKSGFYFWFPWTPRTKSTVLIFFLCT